MEQQYGSILFKRMSIELFILLSFCAFWYTVYRHTHIDTQKFNVGIVSIVHKKSIQLALTALFVLLVSVCVFLCVCVFQLICTIKQIGVSHVCLILRQ